MTAIWNLTKRKGAYAFVAAAALVFVSLSLAQPGGRTRFVYLISGQAATGLQVTVVTLDGKTLNYTTDASGHVSGMAREGKLTVNDPVTGLRLIDQILDRPVTEFKVPLPIRVRGTVSGFGKDPNAITIDCGYGPRMTVTDYQRMVHGLSLVLLTDENKLEGVEMARVPSRWISSKPSTRGRFVTGWIAAVDAPDLLVYNNAGHTAVRTVRLPKGVRARQTVQAGLITPSAAATLEVSIEAGKTDLPLGLMMTVKSVGARGATSAQTTQMLSLLNRRDAALGQFLTKRRQIPLELEGTTRIAGLPAMQSLRLQFVGPVPGIMAERTVTVPQRGTVRIRLTEEELLGKREPLVSFTGVVRIAQGGPPVKGAKVVYSSYPHRYETTTDENGRFTIPRVAANRSGAVFIDAPNPRGAPPFDRVTVSHPVAPLPRTAARGAAGEQVFEIPRPISGAMRSSRPENSTAASAPSDGSNFGGAFVIDYNFPVCGTNYTQDEFQYVDFPILEAYRYDQPGQIGEQVQLDQELVDTDKQGNASATILFPGRGSYLVFMQYTPFVYDVRQVIIIDNAYMQLDFSADTNMPQLTISVFDQFGNRVPADVEVAFPGWTYAADAYEMLTDNTGRVYISCVSRGRNPTTNHLLVSINDSTYGCFNNYVMLPDQGAEAQIQITPAACGQ